MAILINRIYCQKIRKDTEKDQEVRMTSFTLIEQLEKWLSSGEKKNNNDMSSVQENL